MDAVFERLINKTVSKCKEKDIITDEQEVRSIILHLMNKIEYFFNMTKQGLMNLGMVELKGLGKLMTKEYGVMLYRKKIKKKNPEKYEERYGGEDLEIIRFKDLKK